MVVKNNPAHVGNESSVLGSEDSLEKEMATHSSVLAWKIQWLEASGRPQFIGSQRVGYNLATKQQANSETA